MDKVSVVIRTRNEEKFLESVLLKVRSQINVEVEIIIVDNDSTDNTRKIAEKYSDRILSIDEFYPGKAINLGIKHSSHELVSILSGHCVPIENTWLSNLVGPLNLNQNTVGVYGRQVPTNDSNSLDIRDLWTTFGVEPKVQTRDPFFHNANSALKKSLWSELPFDENVKNVEDRIWARDMLKKGHTLYYEPKAVVDHWHGINHSGNLERADNVVRALREFSIYDS